VGNNGRTVVIMGGNWEQIVSLGMQLNKRLNSSCFPFYTIYLKSALSIHLSGLIPKPTARKPRARVLNQFGCLCILVPSASRPRASSLSPGTIDILNTLDSASLLVKLKPRIFQRFPPFEWMAAMLVVPTC
jgi:hypothetical protein